MLTDDEKISARRFMGYPVFGTNPSGNMGWQYYQTAGQLEYRLANLAAGEEAVLRQHLATLSGLEEAMSAASGSLDTGSAGEWVRNPAELAERSRLFDSWCRRLCAFVGVPAGAGLQGGSTVTLII